MIAAVDWKRALLIALVVLLVLMGLPLLMPGMSGVECADCPMVMMGSTCALAVLAGFVFVVALLSQFIRFRRDRVFELLRATVFDRPPQVA